MADCPGDGHAFTRSDLASERPLSVLGWALGNQHMTSEGFLKSFSSQGQDEARADRSSTETELKYGQRDVERTVALMNAMKWEYDGFPCSCRLKGL